ncbi:MAG: Ig-like domain-containing protein [Candidatus Sulfotelmatobacter sp.]
MSSANYKLRLAGAFTALATLALAVSCTGFFQNPTVSTITIDPPTPSVGVAYTLQLSAAATYSDGSTGTLSGSTSCTGNTVCWSSSDTSVATISTGGLMTGLTTGTTTITASSGAVSGTTTATVVETISSMTITPSSQAIPDDGATAAPYEIEGSTPSGTQNISGLVTLTAYQGGTAATNITCTYDGVQYQDCIAQEGTVTTTTVYTIVVTYSGYTGTASVTASLTVTPPPT